MARNPIAKHLNVNRPQRVPGKRVEDEDDGLWECGVCGEVLDRAPRVRRVDGRMLCECGRTYPTGAAL